MKRIAFFGSDPIAVEAVKWLAANGGSEFSLVAIASGCDRPAGRGHKIRRNGIVSQFGNGTMEIFQPGNPRIQLRPWLEEKKIDLGIVFAYGHILREDVLATPPLGFLNLHASLLPKLRGPSPIETAILRRFPRTGMSLMQLVREMDAGPVYAAREIDIGERETATTLREKMGLLAVKILQENLCPLLRGELEAVAQDVSLVSYCGLLKKEDGLLDFTKSAAELEAQVRAFSPWPGSFFHRGGEVIRVGSAEFSPTNCGAVPGTFLGLRASALEIATGGGILRCLTLQRPTRKMLPAASVVSGNQWNAESAP